MSYVESINDVIWHWQPSSDGPSLVDKEIVERSLALRHSPLTVDLADSVKSTLGLDQLSANDRRLFESRVIGGLSTRLAIGSHAVKSWEPPVEAFFELSDDDQVSVLYEMVDDFVRFAKKSAGTVDLLNTNQKFGPLGYVANDVIRHQVHAAKANSQPISARVRNVLSYVNVLPGTFPPSHYPDFSLGSNDSLYVQAFGRNSIPDKDLVKVARDRREFEHDSDMFEHLAGAGFDPGDSNRALAEKSREVLDGPTVIEMMLQWEVAFALWRQNPASYDSFKNYIHVLWPRTDFYPTYEVKADSIEIADRLGLYNPLELAHPDMAIRSLGILARQGVVADLLPTDIPYDARSVQKQTTGPAPWVVRESLARVEHVLRGRVQF